MPKPDKDSTMKKPEALDLVADRVSEWVAARPLAELVDDVNALSEADRERLEWARVEVARRLDRMGKQEKSPVDL